MVSRSKLKEKHLAWWGGKNLRIMVCEDNLVIALDLHQEVAESGHTPLEIATNSIDCLRATESDRPDLVLVDINLADGRTGISLVRQLSDRGIPSIIITGESEFIHEPHTALLVLEKPLRSGELAQALETARSRVSKADDGSTMF